MITLVWLFSSKHSLKQYFKSIFRFVILKTVVRKDLIQTLPLPRRLLDYLSYKHCYSEQVESDSSQSQVCIESDLNLSRNILRAISSLQMSGDGRA